jgi:glycosyltransferase involved in cell wall biosynthesis
LQSHKILIISYLFPPMGGIAVQRVLSLCKYLPEAGFEVHVLRAANAAGPVYDPGLLRRVPQSTTIHNAFTPEIPFSLRHRLWALFGSRKVGSLASQRISPSRRSVLARVAQFALSPEPEVLWVPFALRKARAVIERHGINCVLITAPPFSAFLIGNHLTQAFPQLVHIADFRDEWLTFYISSHEFQNTPRTRRRAAIIERQTVASADLVVAVNESSLQEIRRRYPEQPEGKFACVSNGYEPDVFASFCTRQHAEDITYITHIGTVTESATARYYVQALASLPADVRSRIRTRFVGRIVESERPWLANEAGVEFYGFMPQQEAVRYAEDTDFLLLTMTDRLSMPGKVYEYMATGKPILAIAWRDSELDKLIRQTGVGWCAEPTDIEGIAQMLLRACDEVRLPEIEAQNRRAARKYERPRLVAEYARMIVGVCDRKHLMANAFPTVPE